jgi:hypothetical protein
VNAIWSFWSRPFNLYRHSWLTLKHFAISWILSVETAKRHYEATCLFTDNEGAEFLVDGVGIEVDHVSTELNRLKGYHHKWWALGKIFTYRNQREPFIHLDSDVFLWEPLPPRMLHAPLLAQNPEYFIVGKSDWYMPEKIEAALGSGGWLPVEWRWYRGFQGIIQKGICCGIFGGNRIDFINHYAEAAIRIIDHPSNEAIMWQIDNKVKHMVVLEQFILSSMVEYHKYNADDFNNIDVEYLFKDGVDAIQHGDENGYTHLTGGAKRNALLMQRLEERVKNDYPEHYDRCMKYLRARATQL